MVKDVTAEMLAQMPQIPTDAVDIVSLIENGNPDICERVYFNQEVDLQEDLPLVLILFGGSGAGKDVIMRPLIEEGFLTHVITATSRHMRTEPGPRQEKGDEYIWMRPPTDQEKQEMLAYEAIPYEERTNYPVPSYVSLMIEEYELVEWDVHHGGTLYGLPRRSLEEAIRRNPNGVPLIRTESNGARTLKRTLVGKYNNVRVGVAVKGYPILWRRLLKDPELTFDQAAGRLIDSVGINNALPELANYYLDNSDEPIGNEAESIRRSSLALKTLVSEIRRRNNAIRSAD